MNAEQFIEKQLRANLRQQEYAKIMLIKQQEI